MNYVLTLVLGRLCLGVLIIYKTVDTGFDSRNVLDALDVVNAAVGSYEDAYAALVLSFIFNIF